mmetsp:Transcript_12447/g.20656  ORF Transcript_12447/g.20656 Transcript_12447/m.20656 type:complete len:377 (+) Transcript_12447:41-1171(+)|eukprot:CAMPEP_0119013972 /NCGR_PEP_ID=MMETSP1176-20130426/9283_1 /TAXON_ID=265551 /ORGANISM="Synedropsis recta cf, Strain CCMP1620" /LENGTH=376 /DNA_ID=CAMNT_0006967103 /DNA_START=39 /DNA_END=1169 /DNA_ORIENTATION=+
MTEQSSSAAFAMAAAVAAASELAKNGGMSVLLQLAAKQQMGERERAGLVSVSPEPQESLSSEDEKANVELEREHEHNNDDPLEEEDDMVDDSHNSIHSGSDDEEDANKRLARSRERNREHARRTRLRKKAQLDALQTKAKGLEEESIVLKQSIEECSIASILVGISCTSNINAAEANKSVTNTLLDVSNFDKDGNGKRAAPKIVMSGSKRKRFVSEDVMERAPQPLKLNINGQSTLIGGGKTHINWKSGVYCDENGVQRQLTQQQLETLRRERNRMHAKMTRDRKKGFIAAIEKTIEQLEDSNKKMRAALTQVAKHHFGPNAVTPLSSPLVTGMIHRDGIVDIQDKMSSSAFCSFDNNRLNNKPTRVPHGFSLTAP